MHLAKTQTLILGILADRASSRTANVGWVSPLEQDIYGPGATILAKWVSAATVESPCFKFCMATASDSRRSASDRRRSSSTDRCGATVCPAITESAGVYQAPVTVADVPFRGQFYLQMEDGSGTKMRSPVFTLSPGGASAAGTTLSDPEPQAQAPLGPGPSPVVPLPSPLYPGSPSIVAPSLPPSALNEASVVATSEPNILAAKSRPPTVAFAVPLSAVAAIILVAAGLFLRHRRRLGAQQAKDIEKLSRTGSASTYKSHASRGSEVSHALHVLSRHRQDRGSRPPLFKTSECPTNPSKRDAFPQPTYARWDPPAYGYMSNHRNPPTDTYSSPLSDERPRLPPITTAGSFMSSSDAVTHAVLADYTPPSPTLSSSTSTPRCLLPAPQKLHLRDDASLVNNPLGIPSDRRRSEQDLYERVERNLKMYRRS